jgi:hypothetical protein
MGKAGLAEEHAGRLVVAGRCGGEVVLRADEGACGGLLLSGGVEGAGVHDAEQRAFPGRGEGVARAVDGGIGQVEGLAGVSKVDGLVGHGAQHVAGQGRVVGFRCQADGEGEVVLGGGVLGVVESHPPG